MTDEQHLRYGILMNIGCLFSQIGYDVRDPVRVLLREDRLPEVSGTLREVSTGRRIPIVWQGPLWGSYWGTADCGKLPVGPHEFQWVSDDQAVQSFFVEVGDDILWDATWEAVSIEQAERRMRLSRKQGGQPLGWYDAGAHWQEANAHTAYLHGLADVLAFRGPELGTESRDRLTAQLINGCEYLLLLQELGEARGFGVGSLVHQSFVLDSLLIPADAVKAAAALAHVADVLPSGLADAADRYRAAARQALDWFLEKPRSLGLPCCALPHGTDFPDPLPDEFLTPDLAQALDAAVRLDDPRRFDLAHAIMARQRTPEEAREGYAGDFRLFSSATVSEKTWTHGFDPGGHGFNLGMTHGQNLIPLIHLLRRHPDHPDASRWRHCLATFAYSYFKPACESTPFRIAPLGGVCGEGLIFFAGLWHGCNAIYGQAAALAFEFEALFEDPGFREIAMGNLQWIAGLNAGIRAESLVPASHMWTAVLPTGRYLPVSMINGIGQRWAGTWLNIRGAICNGFSTGDQFQWDTPPTREMDGPHTFTDEDWITHAGAWLSGVSRMNTVTPLDRTGDTTVDRSGDW